MKTHRRTALILTLGLALAGGSALAQTAGSITIEKPFTRATPGGSHVGAGYMAIVNKGAAADRLIAAASPMAEKIEIHEMAMAGGVMKMHQLPDGLPVDAGKSVMLAPGGYHLMIMGLKAPLVAGTKLPVTLTFEKAGTIEVSLDVQPIGGTKPADMPMPHGDMHKM
jgi:copper(I)-binding protein